MALATTPPGRRRSGRTTYDWTATLVKPPGSGPEPDSEKNRPVFRACGTWLNSSIGALARGKLRSTRLRGYLLNRSRSNRGRSDSDRSGGLRRRRGREPALDAYRVYVLRGDVERRTR